MSSGKMRLQNEDVMVSAEWPGGRQSYIPGATKTSLLLLKSVGSIEVHVLLVKPTSGQPTCALNVEIGISIKRAKKRQVAYVPTLGIGGGTAAIATVAVKAAMAPSDWESMTAMVNGEL